jgi:hypothetical protein
VKKVSLLLFVSLLFVVIGFVSCDDGGGGVAGAGQGAPTPTPTGSPPGPVPQSGQIKCWDSDGFEIDCAGTGQDGDIRAGVERPSPRFTDNMDGTITDNLAGLIWLRDANCLGGTRTWQQSLDFANTLSAGKCGLNDGSNAGDWRLPNARELMSLVDYGNSDPALPPGHPFMNFQSSFGSNYWSSTTFAIIPDVAWIVGFLNGGVDVIGKTNGFFVTAVRGGL